MRFDRYFALVSLAVLLLFLAAQFAIYDGIKEQTIQNINLEQMTHARQAASGIQDYMNNVIGTLTFLSHFQDIVHLTASGKELMASYQEHSAADVVGVTRTDAHGRILFTVPDTGSIGKDISQQEHVKLSLKTHAVVVSDVFTAVQGFRTVAVHVPVFSNGEFAGTLAFLLSFDRIAERYIEHIRIGESGYAWVLSAKGVEISTPVPSHIGREVHETYNGYPEILSMVDEMLKGKQGTTSYRYNRASTPSTELVLKHAVFMPIPFGNTFWSIAIATPEDEVIVSLRGLRSKLLIATVALLLLYALCLYFIIRTKIIVREQRQREAVDNALRESEARYKSLFEQNPAPTMIYERGTFDILAVNEAFANHYGYSRQELSHMRLTDLFPDDQKKAFTDIALKLSGYRNVGEWNHRTSSGSVIHIVACSNDLVYEGRESRIAVVTDVSERKHMEEALRESEEKFRLVFENAFDGLSIFEEAEDPKESRLVDCNLRYAELTGKSREELLRIGTLRQFTRPLGVGEREYIRGGKAFRGTFAWDRPDGKENIIEYTGVPFEMRGRKYSMGIDRDVTEHQRLEQQSLRAQRMESLGTLASGIAHDLNNVLAPIMMAIEIMRPRVSDPKGRKWLTTIETSAERGAAIVKQVLAFGRGIGGEQVCLEVRNAVNDIVKITGETFPKSIDIRAEVPGELWSVMADPTQLHQVLLNICVNARDAMPHGGTLAISAENVTLDEEYARLNLDAKPGNYVAITIVDAGTGIPAEIRERIFEPFFTTKELGKGTGLGLSTTLAIVKSHGGFIELSSEMGRGTTFRVYIPAILEGPAAAREEKTASLPEGDGELILIIDDEAAIREIMKEALEAYGYRTMTARDGQEGVALFGERRKEIKAVVTDMMMPNMDGTKAIKAIQSIDPDVPIIAASGWAEGGRPLNASDMGVQAFLAKPYTAEKLLQTLQALLTEA